MDAQGLHDLPPGAPSDSVLPLEPSEDIWRDALDVDLLSEWLMADDSADASGCTPAASSTGVGVDGRVSSVDAPPLASDASPLPGKSASERAVAQRERIARRKAKDAMLARSIRQRKKSEKLALCEQIEALTAHLEALRAARRLQRRGGGAAAEWEERASAQRMARRHAIGRNLHLRRAYVAQRAFLLGLSAAFADSPPTGAELDLRALLHAYTHLRLDPVARARDLEASCSDERLDLAIQILSRETETVAAEWPSITAQPLRVQQPSEIGWVRVGVYALDTTDIRRVFSAMYSALLSASCAWPSHTLMEAQSNVVDAPASNIRYCTSITRYLNDTSGEVAAVETRRISHFRITDAYAVLSWDYPDVDDADPRARDGACIQRDMAGAALVRREVCTDGVERAVCRIICTAVTCGGGASPTDSTRQFLQHLPQAGHASAIKAYEYITGQAQVSA